MKIKLSDLLHLRQGGVYCLVNEELKYIQIWYSRNMMDNLNNVLKYIDTGEYGKLKDHVNNVHLSILELTDNEKNGRVILSGFINKYRNNGYTLYKDTNLINYKLGNTTGQVDGNLRYLVYLEKRNKKKLVVGVFDNKEEMDIWMNLTYPNDIVTNLVLCENKYVQFTNYTI